MVGIGKVGEGALVSVLRYELVIAGLSKITHSYSINRTLGQYMPLV